MKQNQFGILLVLTCDTIENTKKPNFKEFDSLLICFSQSNGQNLCHVFVSDVMNSKPELKVQFIIGQRKVQNDFFGFGLWSWMSGLDPGPRPPNQDQIEPILNKKSDRAEVLKKATEDKFPHLASSHSILYSNDLTANQNSTSNLAELESIIISAQANRDTRILDDSSFDINSNIGEFPNFVTQNRPELTGNDLLNFQNHLSENPFQTVKPSQSIHS